ncbi:MAG TPA: hypothetical protein DCQ30_11830, partial [Acidimicrobiaceae bacterium]|nr:hypothetical protein [Acidimicrobiaceae bacterium]
MVYLGLVDDEYDYDDEYDSARAVTPRVATRPVEEEVAEPAPLVSASVRPLREENGGGGAQVRSLVRPLPADAAA